MNRWISLSWRTEALVNAEGEIIGRVIADTGNVFGTSDGKEFISMEAAKKHVEKTVAKVKP